MNHIQLQIDAWIVRFRETVFSLFKCLHAQCSNVAAEYIEQRQQTSYKYNRTDHVHAYFACVEKNRSVINIIWSCQHIGKYESSVNLSA